MKISQLVSAGSVTGPELVEVSRLSTTVTLTAVTLSAQASDNSYNDSANGFVAAGFTVGRSVRVQGFTGNVANNIFTGIITALTAGKMTIGGADGDVIVDDAAGESVTITAWESRRTTTQDVANLSGAASVELRGLTYTSDTGSTADTDPGAGLFKWNNASQAAATFLYVDNATLDAVTATGFFATIRAGGHILLQQSDTASKWHMYRITSVEAASGYYKFGVVSVAAGTAIDDNVTVLCDFRTGHLDVWAFACSDRVTDIAAGTNLGSMHAPYDANVISVYAGLDTPQTAGSTFTVDINEGGTTILSTKITIDNSEDSSHSAATQPVISDTVIAKGAKISADVDTVGTPAARGLVVYLVVSPR